MANDKENNTPPQNVAECEANKFLPADTRKDYRVVGWVGGHTQDFGKHGIINLTTLTPLQAARLVRNNFSKLEKR